MGSCVADCNQCENIIYQSGDTTLNFTLNNCDPQEGPLNITEASEIWAMFPTLANPPVILKLSLSQITITSGPLGQFSCVMSQSNALLLTPGLINVEVRVTIGGQITVCQILGQLTVDASLFPGY